MRPIRTLRIINSDTLRSMKGIGAFEMLTDVNLSANVIERIEDLANLKLLRKLDLSCNKIRVISSLRGLNSLTILNLSGNKIASMQPLEDFTTSSSKLKEIDLSGNSLHDLSELKVLPKIKTLIEATFHVDDDFSNPFCRD